MEFEKLAVEVEALKAGLAAVTPRVLQGSSGVEHRFDLLFSDGARNYAFDFYDTVTEAEVVMSYAKQFDAGCQVSIVSAPGTVTNEAKQLALSYNMRLLTPEAATTFFALESVAPRHTFG